MPRLRIYTDENVDLRVAEGLRLRGVEARSAHEEGMLGAKDQAHFARAARLQAVIFTHDHHFVELALQKSSRGEAHHGVIFIEMNRLTLGECIRRLALCSDVLSSEDMINHIEFL